MRTKVMLIAVGVLALLLPQVSMGQQAGRPQAGKPKPAREEPTKDEAVVRTSPAWLNTVWRRVNQLTEQRVAFEVERGTAVAGVRGVENEEEVYDQLYYKGGREYPSRLKLKNAISMLEERIKLSPDLPVVPEAKYFIGQCYTKLGELEKARAVYAEVVETYPGSEWAKMAQEQLGKLKEEQSPGPAGR